MPFHRSNSDSKPRTSIFSRYTSHKRQQKTFSRPKLPRTAPEIRYIPSNNSFGSRIRRQISMHPETPAPIPSVPLMTGFQRRPKQPSARVPVSTTPRPPRRRNGANSGELADAGHVLSSLGCQLRRWRDRGVAEAAQWPNQASSGQGIWIRVNFGLIIRYRRDVGWNKSYVREVNCSEGMRRLCMWKRLKPLSVHLFRFARNVETLLSCMAASRKFIWSQHQNESIKTT